MSVRRSVRPSVRPSHASIVSKRMRISCIKVDHLLALGKTFFSERVINVWSALPGDVVDFSSISGFRGSILKIDLCSELKRS